MLCERLGIAPEDFISLADDLQWLSEQAEDVQPVLHVTRPSVAAHGVLDRCLIGRQRPRQPSPCAADYASAAWRIWWLSISCLYGADFARRLSYKRQSRGTQWKGK